MRALPEMNSIVSEVATRFSVPVIVHAGAGDFSRAVKFATEGIALAGRMQLSEVRTGLETQD